MSEIEKLMQNAGVKPLCQIPDRYCGLKNVYEDFTAEKLIELIKWLTKRKDFALDYYPSCKMWVAKTDFQWNYYEETYEHKETEQAIAGLINTLWQDLTDTEKGEIRRILE